MKKILISILFYCIAVNTVAQSESGRYLNEIFEEVNITTDIIYGQNYQFLTGSPILTDLATEII